MSENKPAGDSIKGQNDKLKDPGLFVNTIAMSILLFGCTCILWLSLAIIIDIYHLKSGIMFEIFRAVSAALVPIFSIIWISLFLDFVRRNRNTSARSKESKPKGS